MGHVAASMQRVAGQFAFYSRVDAREHARSFLRSGPLQLGRLVHGADDQDELFAWDQREMGVHSRRPVRYKLSCSQKMSRGEALERPEQNGLFYEGKASTPVLPLVFSM